MMDPTHMQELIEEGRKNGTDDLCATLHMMENHGIIDSVERNWIMGKASGYNECCIRNFINLENLGYPAAAFMVFVLGQRDPVPHVLCPMCNELWHKLNPGWVDPGFRLCRDGQVEDVEKEAFLEEFGLIAA